MGNGGLVALADVGNGGLVADKGNGGLVADVGNVGLVADVRSERYGNWWICGRGGKY